MNNFNLKLTGTKKLYPTIIIDGKIAKFKKNEFGSYQCKYQTEKDTVEVEIVRYLELSGPFWFPIAILFFLISIFGILQPRYDKLCIAIRCKFKFDVGEKTDVILKLANFVNGGSGKAIEVKTTTRYEEFVNEYYIDNKVRKRRKILIVAEILIFLVAVAGIAYLLIKKLNLIGG